jgi:hypothetical protein
MSDIILHGEVIVSLAALGERLFLATTSNVYELVDGKWRRMEFVYDNDGDEEGGAVSA